MRGANNVFVVERGEQTLKGRGRRNLAVGVVVGLAIGGAFGFVGNTVLGTEPQPELQAVCLALLGSVSWARTG